MLGQGEGIVRRSGLRIPGEDRSASLRRAGPRSQRKIDVNANRVALSQGRRRWAVAQALAAFRMHSVRP